MSKSGIYHIYRIGGLPEEEYIGQSVDIEGRWYSHRQSLNAGTHHSRVLQAVWNELGSDAFGFAILEEITNFDLLSEREQWHFDTRHPQYNGTLLASQRETPPLPSDKVTFTYPVDVLDRMRDLAKQNGRSFIGEIVWALRQYIQQQNGKEKGK